MNLIKNFFKILIKKFLHQNEKNLLLNKKFRDFYFYGSIIEISRYPFFFTLDYLGIYYGKIILINLCIFPLLKIYFQIIFALKRKITLSLVFKMYFISSIFSFLNFIFLKFFLTLTEYQVSFLQLIYILSMYFLYFIIIKKFINFID